MNSLLATQGDTASSVGTIHWMCWPGSKPEKGASELVCLHPMPFSGLFFGAIAPLLANGRNVLAPDYPGYGGSQALQQEPSIETYATAMMETVRAQKVTGPVDLLGFHTGCLVAVEMALRFPQEVRRLVLIDVPYFSAEKRQELLAQDFAKGGFRAAFNYSNEEQFVQVTHDVVVMATQSSLLEPSRQSAHVLPNCALQEYPDITEPALVNGATTLATATLKFLDK